MTLLSLFLDLSLGNGFGFNTNILETNIINLAVVIAIVISFVGDALKSLLQNRKETILNNLREADQKAIEAQEKLNQANLNLEISKQKALEIRNQGITTAESEKLQVQRQLEQDITRLQELKNEIINLQQQKVFSQISQNVINLALTKVRQKLQISLNDTFHSSVNNFHIVLLTNYKAK